MAAAWMGFCPLSSVASMSAPSSSSNRHTSSWPAPDARWSGVCFFNVSTSMAALWSWTRNLYHTQMFKSFLLSSTSLLRYCKKIATIKSQNLLLTFDTSGCCHQKGKWTKQKQMTIYCTHLSHCISVLTIGTIAACCCWWAEHTYKENLNFFAEI